MHQHEQKKNPLLHELFRTAIAGATSDASQPSIVVNGSNNVISWGGTVYMRDPDHESERNQR